MIRKPNNFQEALEGFEYLERRLDLPNWTVNGVYIWKLLRFPVFSEYRQYLGLRQPSHPEKQRLKRSKNRAVLDFSKLLISKNPFVMARHPVDRIVVPHVRKHCYDGFLVDPISYSAWRLPHRKTTVILDTTDSLNPSLLPHASSFEVLVRLGWIRGRVIKFPLETKQNKIITELSGELFSEKYAAMLKARVKKTGAFFLGLKQVFSALLKNVQPNYLYIVVSYGCEALIAAAQDFGVQVIEFQHGSIGRGHLGYDFKGWECPSYFPDMMLAFGVDWFKGVSFPEKCIIKPVGYPALGNVIAAAREETQRSSNKLLALSQGPVAGEVLSHIATFAARRLDWDIVIRPHPSESENDLRTQMMAMATTSNWSVEREFTLAEHAAAAAVVFGVNSTALIEALFAGCRVAVLDDDNSAAYFDALVIDGHAMKVQDGKELAEVVDALPDGSSRGYFAPPIVDVVGHVEGYTP